MSYMGYFLFYFILPTSFFFPWLFLHTLLKMIRKEKYGVPMFLTCLHFGIIVAGILLLLVATA